MTVTLDDLYAVTVSPPDRVQRGYDGRSISYFWKLPEGSVIPGEKDEPDDEMTPAVKIFITHSPNAKCFTAAIRTTMIGQSNQFQTERFSLFGDYVGEQIYQKQVARFNAKQFAAFAADTLQTAAANGVRARAT